MRELVWAYIFPKTSIIARLFLYSVLKKRSRISAAAFPPLSSCIFFIALATYSLTDGYLEGFEIEFMHGAGGNENVVFRPVCLLVIQGEMFERGPRAILLYAADHG